MVDGPFGARSRTVRRAYAAAAIALALLEAAWLAQGWGGPLATRAAVLAGVTLAALVAAALAWHRSRHVPAPRRASWRFFGAGCLAWGLGHVTWMGYELGAGRGQLPFPSVGDVGHLAFIPLVAGGLLVLILGTGAITSRLRTVLDGLLIGSALMFAAYATFLRPLATFSSQQADPLARIVVLAYPLGGVLLITLLLLVVSRTHRGVKATLGVIGVALGLMAVADVGFWQSAAQGDFGNVGWPSIGWLAAFLVFGYAGVRPIAMIPPDQRPTPGLTLSLLPLAPFLVSTMLAMVVQVDEGILPTFLFWNAILVVITLFARQTTMLVENVALRRNVESSLATLRDLEADRSRTLRAIAHDLQNPMTPIQIQLGLLRLRHTAPEDARAFDVLDRNVAHVRHLVADLQDLARIQGGGLRLDLVASDLHRIAQETLESHEAFASSRDVALRLQGGEAGVRADPVRVRQVLGNLVHNAVKFTPVGGSVTVDVRTEAEGARIAVTDTGRGLADEEAALLFQPFSQVHDRMGQLPEDRGSGLGLFITKAIVAAHGGRVDVRSPGLGKGSTFSVWLPREPPMRSDPGDAKVPEPAPSALPEAVRGNV